MNAFEQALAHLLPQGAAWPRDAQSVWMRLLAGLAGLLLEQHDYTHVVATEWLPHTTRTRLEEWEAALGLPDPCFGAAQSYEQRRAAVLARLRGYQGAYADSSPAALGAIAAYCAALGTPATVTYHTPFRVGRDRVGRRLGINDGKLYVSIVASSTPFRVGVGRVGSRLIEYPPQVVELACALDRVVPARFEINVVIA